MNKIVDSTNNPAMSLLLCFAHLRWDFVTQRPQHLLNRAARANRVVYFEEPLFEDEVRPHLRERVEPSGVTVAVPVLPHGIADADAALRVLVDELLVDQPHGRLVTWYYTPMALAFSKHLRPDVCVYDCMDELAAFAHAPAGMKQLEAMLFDRSDLVFTGGQSLYEAKRAHHPSVHCFPSSIDARHFERARNRPGDPQDQASIPHPRIGFFGVIDERMDPDLVREVVAAMPEVHFVMLGPVVKIDPATLPQAPNLHWLGMKSYGDLPAYLGNWDAGWMPFALNDATRFISPTKTPEFLAAGLPVTSTAVKDVVSGYGEAGLVRVADRDGMVAALRASLAARSPEWLARVDAKLAEGSWDRTWLAMQRLINRVPARVAPRGILRLATPAAKESVGAR